MLQDLIRLDIERIQRRKLTAYGNGRKVGYTIALGMLKELPGVADYSDFVKLRSIFKTLLKTFSRSTAFDNGKYKSLRNVYCALYSYAYDPNGVFSPVSPGQFTIIGMIADRSAPEFFGLTSKEAAEYIDRYGVYYENQRSH